MIVRNAVPDDLGTLLEFRREAAEWLASRGVDQWSKPYPPELMLESIERETVFLFGEGEGIAATVTLDREDLEPGAWTPEELQQRALYIHKLTVRRRESGNNLGARILDWAGDRAAREGAKWLRLDAWTTNASLHRYYIKQGFEHVRTVTEGGAVNGGPRVSGWLAQRPSARVLHGMDDRTLNRRPA